MNDTIRIGVDLGGTKIEVIALAADGETLLRRRRPTPRHDYRASLQTIADLVREAERELGVQTTVGFATPGAISPASGLIKNSNSVWLNGKPLDRDLAEVLERPVRLRNDADCFALSEATDGAAAGAGCVFGVIIGTGSGAGIVVNGRLLDGPNRIAGEWAHNPLPWPQPYELPGPSCYCGLHGCLETWLSGPGMADDHARENAAMTTENRPDAVAIAAAADAGDAAARASLNRYADRLARGLAQVINVLDPDVIVLGGGMSNIASLYQEVPRRWQRYVFSDRVDTRLCGPVYGDSSGVRGAAWLWR